MRILVGLSLLLFLLNSAGLSAADKIEYKGRANSWGLFVTDSFDTTSVIDVYDGPTSCEPRGTLQQTVIGKERSSLSCDTVCCVERVIRGGETILERRVSTESAGDSGTKLDDIGDTLLMNVGLDAEAKKGKISAEIDGDITYSALNSRALYGNQKSRFKFTDLFGQYEDLDKKISYNVTLGRKSVLAGVIVDGVTGNYFFGPTADKKSKSAGVFFGLSPDPITKHPSGDFFTFGGNFHFIPEFSSRSDTRVLWDSSLVFETYKGSLNRAYLFNRAHFTPRKSFSLFAYSTIELPASGDDSGIHSGHFSLQGIYRPQPKWFLSLGFTQFRVDRFLKEESVKFAVDDAYQADRIGTTLDRSDRFRIDGRVSYRLSAYAQPYVRLRYERRTFDSNKKNLNNSELDLDDADRSAADEDISLLNNPDAYRITPGVRLFLPPSLETETNFSYNQRFKSTYYEFYQFASYEIGLNWYLDGYGQIVWSNRNIANSVPNQPSTKVSTTDYYLGLGGSYRIQSDLFAHLRYDFAMEEDNSLDENILIHSILARIDYRF